MKRQLLSLTLVVSALAATAQTIGEAFYVYRNDGMINTFFRSEVDSIVYSHYDADSVFYDEIIAQIVYTPDSTYWLPLATVDSIGFVTPETKYKPGVIMLEGDIRSYIISVDSLTIHFRTDTPAGLLPHVGDKLVSMELDDIFEHSFLGEVERIERSGESIAVVCTFAGLEDVFEQFYYSNMGGEIPESSSGRRRVTASGTISPGPFSYSLTSFLDASIKPADCAWKLTPKCDVTIAPTISGKGSLIVHPTRGIVVNLDIAYSHVLTEEIAASGEIGFSHKFFPADIPLFQIVPFVWVYGIVTPIVKAEAKIAFQQSFQQTMKFNIHCEASSLPFIGGLTSIPRFTINGIDVRESHEEKLMLDGYVGAGLYGEIGVASISKKILSGGFGFEGGLKLGGNVVLYDSDKNASLISTSLYESLRSASTYLKGYYKIGLVGEMVCVGEGEVNIYEKEWDLYRVKLLPDFSSTTLTYNESKLWSSTTASGVTVFPCKLGFRLFENDSETGRQGTTSYSYDGSSNSPTEVIDSFYAYHSPDNTDNYTVYPTVELFGIEMLAQPNATCSVKATKAYSVLKGNTLTFYYDDKYDNRQGILFFRNYYQDELGYRVPDWIHYAEDIFVVDFDTSFRNHWIWDGFGNCFSDTEGWFQGCSNLSTIKNIQNLDTRYLGSMERMFSGCSSLTSLDLSHFDTSNVTDMLYMFRGCSSLTSLDLSSFNTSRVFHMRSMFMGCSSLTSLNLKSFNTSNVEDMRYMFSGCSSLMNINVSSFNTSNVTDMSAMFMGCKSLTSLDVSHFDTSNVKRMGGPMIQGMFANCSSLTNLDLGSFNTSNVTSMAGMFWGCSSLTNLNLSSFNTSNVTSMYNMFRGCSSLTNLNLSSFNTSNVTSMFGMFSGCSSLRNLNLSSFNTLNVTSMGDMFRSCSSLRSLNLSSFNTSNVTDMSSMFENCISLERLDLCASDGMCYLRTSNVKTMKNMFSGCRSLIDIDLRYFNTLKVENMSEMFADCSRFEKLDLTSFETSSLQDITSMFKNCSNLTSIYATDKFVAPYGSQDVFTECNALRGGKGTKLGHNFYGYDEDGDEITYECYGTGVDARVDKGKDGPGLFTKKE